MAQINIHTTPEFEENLENLMKIKGIKSKSEAIRYALKVRYALKECVERATLRSDFNSWIGVARHISENPQLRFPTDDALWE